MARAGFKLQGKSQKSKINPGEPMWAQILFSVVKEICVYYLPQDQPTKLSWTLVVH